MSKIVYVFMVAIGAAVLPFTSTALARGGHQSPPPSRAPEPLTLIGLGVGLTSLYVAKRRLSRK